MNADGTVNFMETTDIVVDAADFKKFTITASDDDFDPPDSGTVWDEFDLKVVPTDNWGNPSLKTFNDFVASHSDGRVLPAAGQDSLDILDSRVGKTGPAPENTANSTEKYSLLNVIFSPNLIDDLPQRTALQEAGRTFSVRTREGRTRGDATVFVLVDNNYLLEDDVRSQNNFGEASFTIQQPLDIRITLWVPGTDGDQAGETIMIPAGGTVAVTVRAEGLNEGDSVTLTSPIGSVDLTADANGHASITVPLTGGSGAGSVMVTAKSGQNAPANLTIAFDDAPDELSRVEHWANAEMTDPVYLVYDPETGPSDYTVGSDDLMAIIAVYNQSADANIQADTNDDGVINQDDLLNVLGSWGKVDINAPATKPIVLAPGINENAEFSLSLGSERVVAGELVAVDVSVANVQALMGYGFALNYEVDKFEFVSVAPADEDLLKSTGGETLFHHIVADGQIEVVTGMYGGTAVSGGGDAVRFVFRVLREFEDNARFEIAERCGL